MGDHLKICIVTSHGHFNFQSIIPRVLKSGGQEDRGEVARLVSHLYSIFDISPSYSRSNTLLVQLLWVIWSSRLLDQKVCDIQK